MTSKPQLRIVPAPSVKAGAVPPHSLEAEAAVLTTVLYEPEKARRLCALVRPEDFYSNSHREIWEAIVSLVESGEDFDAVSIVHWLTDRRTLEKAGGAPYIWTLRDEMGHIAKPEVHAQVVRDKSRRRRLIATLQAHTAELYGDVGPDEQGACDRVVASVRAVAQERRDARDTTLLGALCEAGNEAAEGADGDHGTVLLPTGIGALDYAPAYSYGLHGGELVIVTAKSGRGKTALACNNIARAVAERRRGVGVFSAEMPRKSLAARMACASARVDYGRIRGKRLSAIEYDRIVAALAGMNHMPMRIDDRKGPTLDDIEASAISWAEDFTAAGTPLGVLIVDHLGKVDLESLRRSRDDSDAKLIGRATERLIEIAERLDCAVLLLSQLNDAGQVRGGRSPEHDAHVWIEIERQEDRQQIDDEVAPEPAKLWIRKARHGRMGIRCPVWFHGPFMLFSDNEQLPPAEYVDGGANL